MPPEASAPVFTVNRPIVSGPPRAHPPLRAATLDRPMPATAVTNPRREIPMLSSPCAFSGLPDRPIFWLLVFWNNRNQDVIETLAVDVKRGRSREQPAWSVARVIMQKWSASQQLILEIGELRAGH